VGVLRSCVAAGRRHDAGVVRYCGSGGDRGAESSRFTFFRRHRPVARRRVPEWRAFVVACRCRYWRLHAQAFAQRRESYVYPSGGLHMDVDGTMLSAAALPGWRWTRDSLTIDVFAGPVVQNYRLTPYDPGSRLRGFYAGAQFATDVWYRPIRRP